LAATTPSLPSTLDPFDPPRPRPITLRTSTSSDSYLDIAVAAQFAYLQPPSHTQDPWQANAAPRPPLPRPVFLVKNSSLRVPLFRPAQPPINRPPTADPYRIPDLATFRRPHRLRPPTAAAQLDNSNRASLRRLRTRRQPFRSAPVPFPAAPDPGLWTPPPTLPPN